MNLFRRPGRIRAIRFQHGLIGAEKRRPLGKNGNARVKVDENQWSEGEGARWRSVETTGLKRAFKSSTQLVSPVKPFYILLFYAE